MQASVFSETSENTLTLQRMSPLRRQRVLFLF